MPELLSRRTVLLSAVAVLPVAAFASDDALEGFATRTWPEMLVQSGAGFVVAQALHEFFRANDPTKLPELKNPRSYVWLEEQALAQHDAIAATLRTHVAKPSEFRKWAGINAEGQRVFKARTGGLAYQPAAEATAEFRKYLLEQPYAQLWRAQTAAMRGTIALLVRGAALKASGESLSRKDAQAVFSGTTTPFWMQLPGLERTWEVLALGCKAAKSARAPWLADMALDDRLSSEVHYRGAPDVVHELLQRWMSSTFDLARRPELGPEAAVPALAGKWKRDWPA